MHQMGENLRVVTFFNSTFEKLITVASEHLTVHLNALLVCVSYCLKLKHSEVTV